MTSAKAFLAVTTEDIAYQENEELFGISTNNSFWISRLRSQVGQLCDMNAVSLRDCLALLGHYCHLVVIGAVPASTKTIPSCFLYMVLLSSKCLSCDSCYKIPK